jgi:predicted RNA-binding Zn ribbon-like protein
MTDDEPRGPGDIEQIRVFLNTWRVPHDTRVPVDDLAVLADAPEDWQVTMPAVPAPGPAEIDELSALRAVLRDQLGTATPAGLRPWLERYPVTVDLGVEQPVVHVPAGPGAVPHVVAMVVAAVAAGYWQRLKACPDCRHVFYDHSRNRSRTWCSMNAGTPDGRACGSIAKVRAYRERHRQAI